MPLSRRQLIQQSAVALTGTALFPTSPFAQVTTPSASQPGTAAAPSPLTPLHRFPRQAHEYYVQQVRKVEREANARRAALRTRADAERYVAEVREKIGRCFGPFPEKTPLNARITAVHPREGYRIENVIFESRPHFPVTANLYVPEGRPGRRPGVIAPCGHSPNGKAASTYQSFAQGLARQGYLVLIFDPMGQGERVQHPAADGLAARFGIGTAEHTFVGNRMVLLDENLPAWFAWDGIRALDYLLSRPEIDPAHVGVTGNSGGGTQTAWLCALEPRFTMAAPSCFITTLRRNIENEEKQDPEQYPWRTLALGLDHADFLAAMAPKPLRILAQERDYFDARGFEEAAERLRYLYRLLGAEAHFSAFIGPDPHGYSQPNREAMYGWFNQHTGSSKGQTEPTLVMETDRTLQCTRTGQVSELAPATAFSIGRDKSKRLASSRRPLHGQTLTETLSELLALPAREGIADYRILRNAPRRRYPLPYAAHYWVETEPGVPVIVTRLSPTPLLSRVPRGSTRAVLYVSHRSADIELREDSWIRSLLQTEAKTTALFACDVRGVGESRPELSTASSVAQGAEYFHAGLGLLFARCSAGERTFDLLRVIDWLHAHGHQDVHLVARGEGALPGTFAAVLHRGVTQVTLRHALRSYTEVAETEAYRWPLSALVPAALAHFDLPDCYRELQAKSLQLLDPVGPEGVPTA